MCGTMMLSGFISNRHVTIAVDGQQLELNTPYKVPANILSQAGVAMLEGDEYAFSEDDKGNQVLTVKRAVPVVIEYNGNKETILTCKSTVGEILEPYGYVGSGYEVNYGLDAAVVTGMNIHVKDVPVAPPVAENTVSTNQGEMAYATCISMEASAYLPTDGNGAGITATGAVARRGIVAVDPDVIPLGTRVYIPGYGTAVAADTGGAIRGNKIDLCMESYGEAINFGRRSVEVYILN
ncbi:3D domain-containing protein [Anaerovibrio sp.]|uniref:3D domain-containing protein n=1 Tax=Anaerovibrio sp. TaxID=1872532 RepID=UPI003F16BAD1